METKHAEEDFKCAVIVNDMAALNIDKNLIDQSALVQSDEVIAMQNGCFCCTLQSDLVEQIIELAQKNIFNYMLIEASGVSEPSQIAPLFELCEDEHDHEAEHEEGPELGEVARLDTCVTVVDAAEFYNNLVSMKFYEEGDTKGTIAELLMEQVEYSNVVVLNKGDLVSEKQQGDVLHRISILNPKAKVLKSCHSKIDVMEILNTHLFNQADIEEDSVMIAATKVIHAEILKSCCEKSLAEDGKKCCKGKEEKNGQVIDSGFSQVLLGVIPNEKNANQLSRHEARFGITSFVYRSRRPFHPVRLYDKFLEPYFVLCYQEEGGPELRSLQGKLERQASSKQSTRIEFMGDLMRSKGFAWIATSNSVMGGWQQAGNVLRIEGEGRWMCQMREMWEGTKSEELIRRDMTKEDGEEWPFADRRQELVFIGHRLKHDVIQGTLDKCLLNDEEMKMGPEKWEESMAPDDKIKLSLDDEYNGTLAVDDEESDEEDRNEAGDDNKEYIQDEDVPRKRRKRLT